MKSLFILLSGFLFLACNTSGQTFSEGSDNPAPVISVDATGEVTIPADIIQFNIQLTQYSESAREAFREHKKLEEFLTDLLLKEGISSDDIKTEPVSIRSRTRGEQQHGFQTNQSVTLKLQDTEQFEDMQLVLIENNFDNFSGQFSSTKIADAEDEALNKAVSEAKREAGILAKAAGVRLGGIQAIHYSGSDVPYRAAKMEMSYDGSSGSLLQFEQTIPVQKNVQVVFKLAN